jgi:NADPH2:quinone reductase
VGRAAIQLAKWAGATVIATASTPEKQVIAREAGADHVFDYRDSEVSDSIRAVAPKIRRIIEVNLNANMDLDLAVSNPGTVIVVYAADGEDPVLPRRRFMSACVTLQFMLLYNTEPHKFTQALEATQEALAAGALTMPPVRYFGITEVVDAHLAQEAGPDARILSDLSK